MAEPLLTPAPEDLGVDSPQGKKSLEEKQLLSILLGYFEEASDARKSGRSDREATWSANDDAYWGVYDASDKAAWQSTAVMPEVPNFVERFAAGMRQALSQSGPWYTIEDPVEGPNKLSDFAEKLVGAMLARSGRSATGQRIGFEHTFQDIAKSGAMKLMVASVTWEDGSVRIRAINPLDIWLDPTGRGLYRIRRRMIDKHELQKMARETDSQGEKNLYDVDAIDRLSGTQKDEDQHEKDESAGHTQEVSSARKPIELLEFLCTILNEDGETVSENQLCIVADREEIIRGPEDNPFWHGRDWIVAAPVISVPFSVYGRTYVESFRQLANTFTEITNLLLDSIYTSSLNAFMAWVEALEDPEKLKEGIGPNQVFVASEDWPAGQDFIKKIELGRTSADGFQMWAGVKAELQEGGFQSELAVGQLPTSGEHTAAAINSATQGAASLLRAIGSDTEEQILEPILELTWMTALQHFDPEKDPEIANELGPEIAQMLSAQRQGFRNKKFRMKASGVTGMLERSQRLRGMLGFLNVVGSNELLAAAFQKENSIPRLLADMMRDYGVDASRIRKTQAERAEELRRAAIAPPPEAGQDRGGSALAEVDPAPPDAPGGDRPV